MAAQDFPSGLEFHKPNSNQKARLWPSVLPTARPTCPSSQVPLRQLPQQEKALERADKSFPFRGFRGKAAGGCCLQGQSSPCGGDERRQLRDGCWVLGAAAVPARAPCPHQLLKHSAASFLPLMLKPQTARNLLLMAGCEASYYHCCLNALTYIDILVQRLIITGYS